MDSSTSAAVGADSEEVVNAFTKFFQAPNLWQRVLYVLLLLAVCLIVMKLLMSVLNRAMTGVLSVLSVLTLPPFLKIQLFQQKNFRTFCEIWRLAFLKAYR